MDHFRIASKSYVGLARAGNGLCQDEFETYVLDDVSAADLFDGPTSKVPSNSDYLQSATKFAIGLPRFTRSTRIQTSDGVDLVFFIKRGMTSPWGFIGRTLAALSLKAIEAFIKIYPPPKNLGEDNRHSANPGEDITKADTDGRPYGVYVSKLLNPRPACKTDQVQHWVLWHPRGQPDLTTSRESKPKDAKMLEALKDLLFRTRWQHILLSKWLKVLDRPAWDRYWSRYQTQRAEGKLEHLDAGDMGVWSGLALVVNASANPHKDPGDVKRGWTATCALGSFTGGDVVLPEWGLRFAQEAGDVMLMAAAVITHMILPHEGERYSQVYFTKARTLDPPTHKYFCDVSGCTKGYTARGGLKGHKDNSNDNAHRAARAARKAAAAVHNGSSLEDFSPANEAEETDEAHKKGPSHMLEDRKDTSTEAQVDEPILDPIAQYFCDEPGCAYGEPFGNRFKGFTVMSSVSRHKKQKHR